MDRQRRSSRITRPARFGLCALAVLTAVWVWHHGPQHRQAAAEGFGVVSPSAVNATIDDNRSNQLSTTEEVDQLSSHRESRWWGWVSTHSESPTAFVLISRPVPLPIGIRSRLLPERTASAAQPKFQRREFPVPQAHLRIEPESMQLPPPPPEAAHEQVVIDITDLRDRIGASSIFAQPEELDGTATVSESPHEAPHFESVLRQLVESHGDQLGLDRRGIVFVEMGNEEPSSYAPVQPMQVKTQELIPPPAAGEEDRMVVYELRKMSRLLDLRAATAEDQEDYEKADRLRSLSEHMRLEARALSTTETPHVARQYGVRWAY